MSDDPMVFSIETEALAGILDSLDYFQVLKLSHEATTGEIKAAYYRESRAYHPDRVFHLGDAELKSRVNRIFKRVTEAYFVLRDPQTRARYLENVTGADREKKLRFDESTDTEPKKSKEEEIGSTPNGRKFFGVGLLDLQAGRLEAAERNFKMALMYEPANPRYQQKASETAQAMKSRK